jgi:hypothetical protein
MRRPADATAQALPTWKAFLGDLGFDDRGMASEVSRALNGTDPAVSLKKNGHTTWIRTLIRNPKGLPEPDTVWELAAAARSLGSPWCAGPLALYASSHLRQFAWVMVEAESHGLALDRLVKLFESAVHVVTPKARTAPETIETHRSNWVLTDVERDIFETTWTSPSDAEQSLLRERDHRLVSAELGARAYDIGLGVQRDVVYRNVMDYFQRRAPIV